MALIAWGVIGSGHTERYKIPEDGLSWPYEKTYMKFTSTLLITFTILSTITQAQPTLNDSIATARNQLVRKSMVTLGSWAVANIATGFILAGSTRGQTSYFWRMNGYFNLVNLGLAGMGYLNALKAANRKYSLADNVQGQAGIEKIYLFNFGLDLAYIGVGSYLYERANTASMRSQNSRDQLKGYGTSIITQGGFLLLMDGVLFLLHHQHSTRLYRKLQQLNINP
jgi:hypothetical protein